MNFFFFPTTFSPWIRIRIWIRIESDANPGSGSTLQIYEDPHNWFYNTWFLYDMYVHLSAALCGSHIQVHEFEKITALFKSIKNCNSGKLALPLK